MAQNSLPTRLIAECISLFVFLPILLSTPLSVWIKIPVALVSLAYLLLKMRQGRQFSIKQSFHLGESIDRRWLLLRFIIFAVASAVVVYLFTPEKLFIMPLQHTLFWALISVFYAVVSVYPQEVIYRQFFFWRYGGLVSNQQLFIFLNASLFCLAHLMFWNNLVLALTLAGGVLFAGTFARSRSVMFTSIEHSLYGLWLFTIGAGEMLAFPMPAS